MESIRIMIALAHDTMLAHGSEDAVMDHLEQVAGVALCSIPHQLPDPFLIHRVEALLTFLGRDGHEI